MMEWCFSTWRSQLVLDFHLSYSLEMNEKTAYKDSGKCSKQSSKELVVSEEKLECDSILSYWQLAAFKEYETGNVTTMLKLQGKCLCRNVHDFAVKNNGLWLWSNSITEVLTEFWFIGCLGSFKYKNTITSCMLTKFTLAVMSPIF